MIKAGWKKLSKEKFAPIVIGIVAFVIMLWFFLVCHPIIPIDTDDWDLLCANRNIFPQWHGWNPIKVFPELMQSVAADIAGLVVYPVFGLGYFQSYAVSNAIIISGFIAIYFYLFAKLLVSKYQMSWKMCTLFSSLFMILHFVFLRSAGVDNRYLFYDLNMTCYYNYMLPNIINAICVLWLLREDVFEDFKEKEQFGKKLLFVIILYFTIFSSIFSNIMLASLAGSKLLIGLINGIKGKQFKLLEFIKGYLGWLIVLILWAVTQIFEVNGARAASLEGRDFKQNLIDSLKGIMVVRSEINSRFVWFVKAVVGVTIVLMIVYRKKKPLADEKLWTIVVAFFVNAVYLILLCSKAGSTYITRVGVFFGIAFWGLILLMYLMKYCCENLSWMKLVCGFAGVILLFSINTRQGNTFMEGNLLNAREDEVLAIDNAIMNQVVDADKAGLETMKLYVPWYDHPDNFPIATYGGERITNTLYVHGVVSRFISVDEVVPIKDFKEKYYE